MWAGDPAGRVVGRARRPDRAAERESPPSVEVRGVSGVSVHGAKGASLRTECQGYTRMGEQKYSTNTNQVSICFALRSGDQPPMFGLCLRNLRVLSSGMEVADWPSQWSYGSSRVWRRQPEPTDPEERENATGTSPGRVRLLARLKLAAWSRASPTMRCFGLERSRTEQPESARSGPECRTPVSWRAAAPRRRRRPQPRSRPGSLP